MIQKTAYHLLIATGWLIMAAAGADAFPPAEQIHQLLPGDRVLLGIVEEVRSDQARINTGEMQPRFIPMNVRKDKSLPTLGKGDRVEITVNDQNLLVDVHVVGESSHHRVLEGRLAGPLVTGHDKVVIRTREGREEFLLIRPVARSKVASVPVGVDAVFLIDELNKVVDVTFESKEAVGRAAELWINKSPLKGNLTRLPGVIVSPLRESQVLFRTEDGRAQWYQVRSLVQSRLARLAEGDEAVLLVDDENTVQGVAFVPVR